MFGGGGGSKKNRNNQKEASVMSMTVDFMESVNGATKVYLVLFRQSSIVSK